jgi:hypothetical protein
MRQTDATMLDTAAVAAAYRLSTDFVYNVVDRSSSTIESSNAGNDLRQSARSFANSGGWAQVLPREFAGSIVAVTLLRPVFLLRYRAASATLSSLSGIFFSLEGT